MEAFDKIEERSLILPGGKSGVTLDEVHRGVRVIINNGFVGGVAGKFPGLTKEQLDGLFLDFREEEGNIRVVTGIRYGQPLPQAKEVADHCRLLVKNDLQAEFPSLRRRIQ